MWVLHILLQKCTNLADDDTIGKSDPYVRFELEQDNTFRDKDYGKKCSSKKKDELNPEYNEEFTFSDIPTLHNMVLKVKVMDDDIFSDDKVGKCKIKLDKIGFTSGVPYEGSWVSLSLILEKLMLDF